MKASVHSKYGAPDVLSIKDVEKPTPSDDQVLVRVYATTVNRTDCGNLWAKPFLIRLFLGLFNPRSPITGSDFAGTVEAVGGNVKSFKVGDRIMGFSGLGLSSHAEYLTVRETRAVIGIPDNVTFSHAAACLEGGIYALSSMINKVNPTAGQRALVNGGTGAIGSAAVQFLKERGVEVTATCKTSNLELVKSLGASRVIDYSKDDFTKDDEKYNFIFDTVGKSSFGNCKPLLLPGGTYISADAGPMWENTYLPLVTAVIGDKKVLSPIPRDVKKSLSLIQDFIGRGKFKPVIDRAYPLEKIAEAYEYVASGQKIGNVVITLIAE
ncbi:MAG TPA: NAD(P)-dependent alcohol dehydrogenase [Candidatus Eremiobacteraceae bacterium]